jgi:predicted nucleic acid-binding protein
MKVVDATVVAALLLRPSDAALRSRFASDRLAAPHLVDAEVMSAMRGNVLRGQVAAEAAREALPDLAALPIVRHDHRWLLRRAWHHHPYMTAYDALYVVLAEALEAPLWTRDVKLAVAAKQFVAVECP